MLTCKIFNFHNCDVVAKIYIYSLIAHNGLNIKRTTRDVGGPLNRPQDASVTEFIDSEKKNSKVVHSEI